MYYFKNHLWLAAFAAFCLALLPATSQAQKRDKPSGGVTFEYDVYQLNNIDGAFSGFAADLNDIRVVVGSAVRMSDGQSFAAYWDVTVAADGTVSSHLSLLPQSNGAEATGVNNLGEVVGKGAVGSGLFWQSVNAVPLPLDPLPGDTDALPQSINDAGTICGTSMYYESGVIQQEHPVVWRVNSDDNGNPIVSGPFHLPSVNGTASDLSDADADGVVNVVGNAWDDQTSAGVIWQVQLHSGGGISINPEPTILQIGANVNGINNTAVVCGDSGRPDWIAMLWAGTKQFPLARPRTYASSGTWDLNDAGVVVGWVSPQVGFPPGEAAVWAGPNAKPVLLSDFLSRRSPFDVLTDAPAINQAGVIVGAGWVGADGVQQAFIALRK